MMSSIAVQSKCQNRGENRGYAFQKELKCERVAREDRENRKWLEKGQWRAVS